MGTRNVWLIVFLVVTTLVLCEAGLRWTQKKQLGQRKIGWEYPDYLRKPKPYVMFGPTPGEYRSPNPVLPKPADEFRIFIIGGSTVEIGEPPISQILETLINTRNSKSNRKFKVYNFGVVSQNSSQAAIRIFRELTDLSADLILEYDGGNDIMDPFYWDPRPGFPYNFMAYENNPLFNPDLDQYPLWSLIGLGSRLVRTVLFDYYQKNFFNLEQLRNKAGYQTENWRQRIAETYVGNCTRSSSLASANSIRYRAFFQPLLFLKKSLTETERKSRFYSEDASRHSIDIRIRIRNIINAQDKLKAKMKLYDLSEIFDNETETVFADYIHIIQSFNTKIAEVMFDLLAADGALN